MLPFKPHSLTVHDDVTGKTADDEREMLTHADAGPVLACQATESTPETIFQRFGIDVRRPWLLLFDMPGSSESAEAKVVVGAKLSGTPGYLPQEWIVRAVAPFKVGLPADHVAAALEEITGNPEDEE